MLAYLANLQPAIAQPIERPSKEWREAFGVVLHKLNFPAFVTAMAWEERERGGRYYYRSVRDGERVRKKYVGRGETAEILARGDETIRLVRKLERDNGQEELERMEELAAPLLEAAELAEILARAHLVAGGYHRHKGSEWRLRRGHNS